MITVGLYETVSLFPSQNIDYFLTNRSPYVHMEHLVKTNNIDMFVLASIFLLKVIFTVDIPITFLFAKSTVFNNYNMLTVLSVPYSSKPFFIFCKHACTQNGLLKQFIKSYDLKMEYSYD